MAVNQSNVLKTFVKSPIFNPLDIVVLALGIQFNKKLDESVSEYDTSHFKNYQVPVYYVAGENDWQVPSVVAENYYHEINAPYKGFYWIKNAGHATNLDNPNDFNKAVAEILKVFSQSPRFSSSGNESN